MSGESTNPVAESSGAPQGPGEVPSSIAVSGLEGFAGVAGGSLPALREDQIGNAVVFLSHPKVYTLHCCASLTMPSQLVFATWNVRD